MKRSILYSLVAVAVASAGIGGFIAMIDRVHARDDPTSARPLSMTPISGNRLWALGHAMTLATPAAERGDPRNDLPC